MLQLPLCIQCNDLAVLGGQVLHFRTIGIVRAAAVRLCVPFQEFTDGR